MGCSPLGKMVSKAFSKCNGEKRKGTSRVLILSPPPSYLYSRPRTVVKTVNFSNDAPIIIIPPDSTPPLTVPKPLPTDTPQHPPKTAAAAAAIAFATASAAGEAAIPAAATSADTAKATRLKLEEPDRKRSEPGSESPHVPPPCYVMSPLPRSEDHRRRREYFSAEYNYYPTPIREGIYNIATDPNRLATIFSEENPNACSIV